MRAADDIGTQSGIAYTQRADVTSEDELNALVNVYRLIIESARKRGRLLDKSGPEDARKDQDARTQTNCT
jgi:hypothetical protein